MMTKATIGSFVNDSQAGVNTRFGGNLKQLFIKHPGAHAKTLKSACLSVWGQTKGK